MKHLQRYELFRYFVINNQRHIPMGKEKKSGKRLTKKQLFEVLASFFQANPNDTFSFKEIFKALKLTTHPAKMLAIDVMEEMAWDDFLAKSGENAYRLNTKGQVQEGTFVRKANGKNTFQPDDGGTPVFVSERNSMAALMGDRVKVQFMARRQHHIKEAMVACRKRHCLPCNAGQSLCT